MNITPEQSAFLQQIVPSDALITSAITIVTWIDPITGNNRWTYDYDADTSASSLVGVLELTKHEVIRADERLHGEAF